MTISEQDMKVWKDIIEWLVTQDGFILIGTKDNEVNAKSSVDLDEAYEMVNMVGLMLADSLESGENTSRNLQ